MAFVSYVPAHAADAEQWGVWETSLDGPRDGSPYLDVELSAAFDQDGKLIVVSGFYDGDGVYKVRFSPPAPGPWRYETRSNRPELNGKSGSFTAGPPAADNHGPIQVFKTFYLGYADGTLYHREKYQKPVIYDECKYEGNIPQGWGNLDAKTMTQRFWLGTLGGCYVGHGETYLHPEDILWWSKGGVLHGESPRRIQWLKDLLAAAPAFDELQPLGDDQGKYLLAKPGEYYLLYCTGAKAQTIQLGGERPYKVDLIDPWEMTVLPLGTARPGASAVQPAKADLAYRFVPYAPGEKLRPQARISASPRIASRTTVHRASWSWGSGRNLP